MSAFVIVEIDIHDPQGYDEYKKMAPPSIAKYDGKYLVRGGACDVLEGGWMPRRIVVLQFPSVEKAKAWWNSPEYAEAKSLRHRTATSRMIVVEGMNP